MSKRIQNAIRRSGLLWLCALCAPFGVHADEVTQAVVYDRAMGELSPGTQAPTREELMNAIRSASPTGLTAMLEYGERVECLECIPLLETKLLSASDPKVREMSAWWLRRRPFGFARAAVKMRTVLAEHQDPVMRARAAEALGEFMNVNGLPALQLAVTADADSDVRLASVRALGRLNARGGHAAIAQALSDSDVDVRQAALTQVLRVNAWTDADAIVGRLDDENAKVRQRAANVAGELALDEAADRLVALLQHDDAPAVRQAAAWALGRIGGGAAQSALRDASESESDKRVQDAIDVAVVMAH